MKFVSHLYILVYVGLLTFKEYIYYYFLLYSYMFF